MAQTYKVASTNPKAQLKNLSGRYIVCQLGAYVRLNPAACQSGRAMSELAANSVGYSEAVLLDLIT